MKGSDPLRRRVWCTLALAEPVSDVPRHLIVLALRRCQSLAAVHTLPFATPLPKRNYNRNFSLLGQQARRLTPVPCIPASPYSP